MEPKARMKLLVDQSQNIDIETNIPINRYFCSAKEMVKKAISLEEEGDLEKAFVLYLRFVTLFLDKLVKHPGYSTANAEDKEVLKKQCDLIFDRAETLKANLLTKFNIEHSEQANNKSA